MKTIIYILLLLVFTTLSAQDRNVFWVHGLGGSANFWDRQYANAQRSYQIRSSGFTYPTNEGVKKYSDRIRAGSANIKGSRTIAVGHSMGGVALRQANKDDNSLYGGFITMGSPLDGARLANEVISGGGRRFINQSLENLRRGPIASKTRSKWQKFVDTIGDVLRGDTKSALIRLFANKPILDITEKLADDFNEKILNRFNPNDPSIRDLAENSSYMRSIRNFRSAQPKILAWGNENSPVHARLLASSITLDNGYAGLIINAYNELGNSYIIAANGVRIRWYYSRKIKNRRRAEKEAWNAGADYLRRGWEIAWNELTDARFLERYTTTEQVYVCNGESLLEPIPISADQDYSCFNNRCNICSCCRWENQSVTRTRWVNTPSDGLIKRASQRGDLSNWGGKPVELKEVNHMEMGVHPETDKLFKDSFEGRHGKFFKTPTR